MMKKQIAGWLLGAAALTANTAFAGCLDSATSASTIVAKIRGFYVNKANQTQYVIFDKASCYTSNYDTAIGVNTRLYSYLTIDDQDAFLQSALFDAYKAGHFVELRIGAAGGNGYNVLQYVVTPAGARNQ